MTYDSEDQNGIFFTENVDEENIEIEEEEIAGVNEIQETENDFELGRGRRKKQETDDIVMKRVSTL